MSASTTACDQNAQQTLLASYEGLLSSVEYMHELANAEQWAELIEQRTSYVVLVEQLRELDATVLLDPDELGKLIGVSQRQRDLHRAYAPQQGALSPYASDDADAKRSS